MTTVSVMIGVRDAAPYVAEAIESVLAQLGHDDEVVVVDDGSTDGTAAVLAGYGDRLRVITQGPLGLSTARNRGLDASRGELLAFVDADDRWAPGSLAALQAALARHPDADAVLGRTDEFLDAKVQDPGAAGLRPPQQGVRSLFLGALLARRAIFDAVRFDEDQPMAITTDWLGRARAHGFDCREIDAVTLERRIRPDSMTADAGAYQQALLTSLRANIRGRRPS